MKIETLMRIAMIAMVAILAGCGSYYKVTDPASKRMYYTEDVYQERSGAVKFKDAKTGAQVTLPASGWSRYPATNSRRQQRSSIRAAAARIAGGSRSGSRCNFFSGADFASG